MFWAPNIGAKDLFKNAEDMITVELAHLLVRAFTLILVTSAICPAAEVQERSRPGDSLCRTQSVPFLFETLPGSGGGNLHKMENIRRP